MKWGKAVLLATLISGCSLTVGFAEIQAFIQSEKLTVSESNIFGSDMVMELRKGDRVEVLETTSPLRIKPFDKIGYISLDKVELFDISKSGEVTLSKDIRITSDKGIEILPNGTILPIYDYINNHYMVKWEGFYYFIHDTVVVSKFNGNIIKPEVITEQVKEKLILESSGLSDLFADMNNTLIDYQSKKKVNTEDAITSLLTKGETVPEKEEIKKEVKVDTNFTSGEFNLQNYMNIPIIESAVNEIGKPYVWGAIGPSSYDCSGFTYAVYKSLGITIPRVSADQGSKGTLVDIKDLKAGDLVFFDTRAINNLQDITDNPNSSSIIVEVNQNHNLQDATNSVVKKFKPTVVTHVGIYIGDGYFIHASSGQKKVVIQDMNINYYQDRLLWAKRYM